MRAAGVEEAAVLGGVGFAAPFVVVKRRSDGAVGSLEFTHSPHVYFAFRPDTDRPESTGTR